MVTIYGTVAQTLADGPQLVLRDTQNNNRTVRVYALEDLPVRTQERNVLDRGSVESRAIRWWSRPIATGRELHRADDSDSVISCGSGGNA